MLVKQLKTAKEQKGGFLSILLGTLTASMLGSALTGRGVIRAGKDAIRAGDSFWVEHIPKEIRKFFRNKNIIINIYGIQAYDSIMCGYFGIGFIDFMLKGKSLLECTNLFSANDYWKEW